MSIGPPRGNLTSLVSKVGAINAKHGPFHALFVTGDFFSSSQGLNEDEARFFTAGADEGDLKLVIPTYISFAKQSPPPEALAIIAEAEKSKASTSRASLTHAHDSLPVKLAHNLFWLGKDRVNWVSRDDPSNAALAVKGNGSDQIVDEEAERSGLRVAVCGGQWSKEEWAKEIQGVVDGLPATAKADPTAPTESDTHDPDTFKPYILPSGLQTLYQHPGFQPAWSPGETTSATSQTLAEARKAMLAAQAGPTASTHPSIDVLLLPSWPSGVLLFSKSFPPSGVGEEARLWGLPPLAEVARRSCPRYIFAPTPEESSSQAPEDGVFWEREPYNTPVQVGPSLTQPKITRFISLANFGNAKKVRWFVALNMAFTSSLSASTEVPKGASPSPFGSAPIAKRKGSGANGDTGNTGLNSDVNFRWQQNNKNGAKRQRSQQDGGTGQQPRSDGPPPAGYVCRVCGSTEHYVRLCPHKQAAASSSGGGPNGLPAKPAGAEEALGPRHPRRAPIEMVGPSDCWFCLSNTGCAKHLVVAIGNESYVALPKGQLPPAEDASSPVPGGGHVLIVPIGHAPSIEAGTNDEAVKRLRTEVETYLSSLAKLYASYDCSLVCWSVVKLSNTRAGHMQVQCVPVPEARVAADPNGPGALLPFILNAAKERGLREDGNGLTEVAQSQAGPDGRRLFPHHKKGDEYFELHVSSPSASVSKTFLLDLSPAKRLRFDYQFARSTLAAYLGVPHRADWRACARSSEKVEAAETKVFREAYREFMPEEDDDSDDDEGED